jgi:hypothetical protein
MAKKVSDAARYDTDQAGHSHYHQNYEEHFQSLHDKEVKLLELDVFKGGSLLLWRDYFPCGTIVGLDLNRVELADDSGSIRLYQGAQQDIALLDPDCCGECPRRVRHHH